LRKQGFYNQVESENIYSPTDKQVLAALVKTGELKESALYADIEIDGDGENIYLTDVDAGMYPLCELILKEDQTNYSY